jgi:hypothetical protein
MCMAEVPSMALQVPVALDPPRPPSERFQRVWPPAILIMLLMITAAWMVLLGYGLVELIEVAL